MANALWGVALAALAVACGGSSTRGGDDAAGGKGGAGGVGGSAASGGAGGSGGSSARGGSGGTGGSSGNYFISEIRQGARTKLDVLVMVDNSSSMAGKQRLLADAIPVLV